MTRGEFHNVLGGGGVFYVSSLGLLLYLKMYRKMARRWPETIFFIYYFLIWPDALGMDIIWIENFWEFDLPFSSKIKIALQPNLGYLTCLGPVLSRVQFFVSPWTGVHQASLSMGFLGQKYWSQVALPTPDLPNAGIEPRSLVSPALAGGFFTTSTTLC